MVGPGRKPILSWQNENCRRMGCQRSWNRQKERNEEKHDAILQWKLKSPSQIRTGQEWNVENRECHKGNQRWGLLGFWWRRMLWVYQG